MILGMPSDGASGSGVRLDSVNARTTARPIDVLNALSDFAHASGRPDLAGNVEKADLLCMRVVERMNRLGGRLQQDRATLFRKIRLSFRR
jgi:hypothetical protein